MTEPKSREQPAAQKPILRSQAPKETPSQSVSLALSCLNRLGWIYRALGVDHGLMLRMVRTKFLLEERHRKRGGGGMQLGLMVLIYLHVGLALGGVAFFMRDEGFLYVTLVSSLTLFLLLLLLFGSLSVALFDTSDVDLLASLPIDDRTVAASRVSMQLSTLVLLLACLGSGPLLIGVFAMPTWSYVLSVGFGLLQAAALALGFTLCLYLGALRFFNLARFRNLLVYIQAGASVGLIVLAQVGPHLVRSLGLVEWFEANLWVRFGLPILAPGALLRLLDGSGQPDDLGLLLAGMGITLAMLVAATCLARQGIVAQLVQLEGSGGRARQAAKSYGISGWLGRRSSVGLGRAGWFFMLAQAASDRAFRMRALVHIGSMMAPVLGILLADADHWSSALSFAVYVPFFLLIIPCTMWEMTRYAEFWEAAQIFDDLTPKERNQFTLGGMQALLARTLVVPLLCLIGLMGPFLPGTGLLGLIGAASLAVWVSLYFLPRYGPGLPFSRRPLVGATVSGNIGLFFMVVTSALALGGLWFVVMSVPFAVYPLTALSLWALWRAWRGFSDSELGSEKRTRGAASRIQGGAQHVDVKKD